MLPPACSALAVWSTPSGGSKRVAGLFGRRDGHHGKHKQQRHRGQHGPALACVAHRAAEGETQRRRDQEDRQHLEEVAERRRVLVRMGRVGVEEAAAVGAQHLDGFLRSNRAHGQGLLGGFGVFHDRVALVIFQRLAVGPFLGNW
jgi:hypothetical protein